MNSYPLTRSRRRRCSFITAFAAAVALATAALACNVPVFRFALERWRPDAFRVTLLHRGPLTDTQREMIRPLTEAEDKDAANVVLRTFDVSELERRDQGDSRLLASISDEVRSRLMAGGAWLIVKYPEHLRIEMPVWEGPLSRETARHIVDSPVRQELIKRLAAGQTTVWVVLESGQKEKDDAAASLVESQLRQLEQTLKLPELTNDPADDLLAATPLKVAFSVLRVPHGSMDEQALAGMLVRCEPDLADRPDPIVFPVFGRGRALLPLIGAGITEKNIHDAAEFLVGPCSCQVKDLNPGFDLLLSADWDSLLTESGQQLTAIQTGGVLPRESRSREAELVPIPSGSSDKRAEVKAAPQRESASAAASTNRHSWIVTGAFVIGVVAFVVLLSAVHAGKS